MCSALTMENGDRCDVANRRQKTNNTPSLTFGPDEWELPSVKR
jgi:hypothetical protein